MRRVFRAVIRATAVCAVAISAGALRAETVAVEFNAAERAAILSLSSLQPPPRDLTNRFSEDPRAIAFGRTLFFEPRLSSSRQISCSSCHDPQRAWTDGRRLAVGLATGSRKTPTLANVAYYRWFFRDGRAATLWQQALQPIQDSREMGQTKAELVRLIDEDPVLKDGYERIFGPTFKNDDCRGGIQGSPDCIGDADTVLVNVAKALSAFMSTLVYRCSPFDQFADGLRKDDQSTQAAISHDAQLGLQLFVGRAGCFNCHHGPNFSDSEFHDTRVPNWPDRFHEDPGRYDGIEKLQKDPYGPASRFSDAPDGTMATLVRIVRRGSEALGQFKTPTLRNVAITGPYMHAGEYLTLAEVIDHYSEMADKFVLNHHEYGLMDPLHLSSSEKARLLEFLNTLTDPDLKEGRYPSPACPWR